MRYLKTTNEICTVIHLYFCICCWQKKRISSEKGFMNHRGEITWSITVFLLYFALIVWQHRGQRFIMHLYTYMDANQLVYFCGKFMRIFRSFFFYFLLCSAKIVYFNIYWIFLISGQNTLLLLNGYDGRNIFLVLLESTSS